MQSATSPKVAEDGAATPSPNHQERARIVKHLMIVNLAMLTICAVPQCAVADGDLWVHPLCRPIPADRNGPFVAMPDGRLMTVDTEGLRTSKDEGKTWSEPQPVCKGINPKEPASFYVLRTGSGTLVIVYLDLSDDHFSWDDAAGEPKPDCRCEFWAIRSLDGGKTWIDRQRLLDGYNANFFGLIQTRAGRIIVTAEHLVSNPGHWVACSFMSENDGKTWKRSNLIDLGGHGHHDGATEPTIAELSDGRLLMLMHTNLDRFWQAFSDDGGRYWRHDPAKFDRCQQFAGPSREAQQWTTGSCLESSDPQGGTAPKGGPGVAAECAASWYRGASSIAFSDDNARSWTKPLLLARAKNGLSYPYVFERRAGDLWFSAGFGGPLRVRANEEELFQEAKKNSMPESGDKVK